MKPLTSEIGISIPNAIAKRQSSQRGFTLWELLVVVAIVAITMSLVTLSFSLGDEHRDLKRITKDLGKVIHLLSREAVFKNLNYAISVQRSGYQVLVYKEGEWHLSEESFYQKFKMKESQFSRLFINDQTVAIQSDGSSTPQILILASGEMTPFEWRIGDRKSQHQVRLQGDLLGTVIAIGPEPI